MNNNIFNKKIELVIFLITLIYAGYFLGPQLANQNSRYNAIYSVVEDGLNVPLFSINKFILDPHQGINTVDWSLYNGNFYSNKAPGTILLGVPVYFVIANIQSFLGLDLNFPPVAYLNVYLINFFISVLPLAIASVCFCRLSSLYSKKNLELTLILIFCTPLLPYSTSLWGHSTACSFLIIGAYYLIKAQCKKDYFLAGLFLATTCSVDYFAILAVITIILYGLIKKPKCLFGLIMGGCLPILLTLWYHYICFGNIFATSTTYTNIKFLDENLLLGMFGTPKIEIFKTLLLHPTTGILFMMPIFLLSIFGIVPYKNKSNYLLYVICLTLSVTYCFWNSSFNGWHGGNPIFYRYLIIISPFLVILLIPLLTIQNLFTKLILFFLSLASAFNMLVITSVSTMTTTDLPTNPLYGDLYSLFFEGNLSYGKYYIRNAWLNYEIYNDYKHLSSWNIGQLLGIQGLYSLVPLLITIVFLFFLLNYHFRKIKN